MIDNNENPWLPTHEIRITRTEGAATETILVHLDADETGYGAAYTRDEWEKCSTPDWSHDPIGWVFQGQIPICKEYEVVRIRKVSYK